MISRRHADRRCDGPIHLTTTHRGLDLRRRVGIVGGPEMLTSPKLNVPTTRFALAVVSVSVPLLAARLGPALQLPWPIRT